MAIVSPTYGVRENGALTAMISVFPSPFEPLSPQAGARQHRTSRRRSRVDILSMLERVAAQVGDSHVWVLRTSASVPKAIRRPGREHRYLVGDPAYEAEIVLDQEEREALAAELLEQFHEAIQFDGGSTGGGSSSRSTRGSVAAPTRA